MVCCGDGKVKLQSAAMIAVVLASTAGTASGATTSANLTVQVTVVDLCTVQDATLAFGTVNPAVGVTVPTTGLINVTCSLGTAFTVGLGDGLNYSSGDRRMKRSGSSDYLNYNLYRDILVAERFGDTGGSDRASGLGLGLLPTPVSVFGTVPGSQTAPSGSYSDTVQINVYY
jgi:spore coat protein U-like protein